MGVFHFSVMETASKGILALNDLKISEERIFEA